MLRAKLQNALKILFTPPPQFRGLGNVWGLSLTNFFLIVFLGGLMMLHTQHPGFLIMTLIMVVSAGTMVFLLLIKLQEVKVVSQRQQVESKAYETVPVPLLVLTPDFHFCYGNRKARESCWWAESIPFLKKILSSQDSKEALDRLIKGYHSQAEQIETLTIQGSNGEEKWRVHSLPLENVGVWKCTNVTQEKEEKSKYLSQLKTLILFLDHAIEGLFSLNEKGILLFCNDKFAKWLGYEREAIVGKPFSHFLANPRGQGNLKVTEIQGKCDFITASSRVKSAFLEQATIPTESGFITYSYVNIHTPFANQSDLNKILEMTPLPAICLDEHNKIQDGNISFREKFWFEDRPMRGESFMDMVADFQKGDIQNEIQNLFNGSNPGTPLEIHLNDPQESIVTAYFANLPVKNEKGFFVLFQDITDQKRFESQLVQSQKMQAVGQLAGGIAHDFNNLLTAMIGFCDLMLLRHSPGDQSFTDIMQIKQNANRAANLVRQLLAFSRQQTLQPKVLDITECLAELSALLRRLIGSNIELKIKHARDLGLVLVDQGQFEQVIINLVVNARDAIESTGTITLSTQNCDLKKAKRFGHDIIPPGSYVLVEVTDTGTGIKPEIINRIFDPFFSTKEVGSGTGLGLSTAYGIVKQMGGFIYVTSTVGKGTVFSIYLPHHATGAKELTKPQQEEKTQPQDLTGSSTILLVEDEDAVRLFSGRALRSKGYKVLEAINGAEALKVIQSSDEKIDLVISDVVMPQMDGPTFINEISLMKSKPKVLFISGYTEDTFHDRLKEDSKIQFLAKPFSLNDLAVRVKEILGGQDQTSPSLQQEELT